MTRIPTTLGLFPLPDWAKEELSSLKGHQKSDLISGDDNSELAATYDRVRAENIDRQLEANLGRIVEGQGRWDDMLGHPLAVHDAVETGGLVRYYDNNNFYRELRVIGELDVDGDVANEVAAANDLVDDVPVQAVLPGPYSLADLATNEFYSDEDAFLEAIAAFLAGEVQAIEDVDTVFFLEPSLAVTPPADRLDAVATAIDTVSTAVDAEVIVQTYWDAPTSAVYRTLLDSPIDGIGLDLIADADAARSLISEYGATEALSLGVVDGTNTRIEEVSEINDQVENIATVAPTTDRFFLTTNTETFYLPVNRFEEKLALLGRAAEEAEVKA